MKIKREYLNRLIKSVLNEIGPGAGMDPTGTTMPRGMKRSEYKQLEDASTDPHNIIAALSIADPTMASDLADAIVYYLEGKPEEAALVLALSAGGIGAGALAVKLGKGFKAAGKNADEAKEMGEDLARLAKNSRKIDNIVIPKYGEQTTIGYHGTSKANLKNIQKYGLDNKKGKELGAGLDSNRGSGFTDYSNVTSNWTYTPEAAIDYGSFYGDDAILLRFDTKSVTDRKGLKSNKEFNLFNLKIDGKDYYAIPTETNEALFHKYSFGELENGDGFGVFSNNKKEVLENMYIVEKTPTGIKGAPGPHVKFSDISEKINEKTHMSGNYFEKDYYALQNSGGVSDKPIPPELISVSFDGGKTYKKLLDLDLQ